MNTKEKRRKKSLGLWISFCLMFLLTQFRSSEDELEDIDYYPSLPFAALLSAFKAQGLKVTCLLCYSSEGDNIPHAFLLAEPASKLTALSLDKFHEKHQISQISSTSKAQIDQQMAYAPISLFSAKQWNQE